MAKHRKVTRRAFLQAGATGILGAIGLDLVAACTPAPAPPAATAPPAAAAPTAAPPKPQATAAPVATAPAAPQKLGANLIGKWEGPEIIVDPAQMPKKFNEAPMLAEIVKAGTLPPVEQRVSEEPLVIKPVNEIGKFGGTWRRGFSGPADQWNGRRVVAADTFMGYDWTGNKIVPNLAKEAKMAEDGLSLTLKLRKGLKWSDGKPFTADDIVFWYDDVYGNKDLAPTLYTSLTVNGKPISYEKIDDYTVKYKFPEPYFFFFDQLASNEGGVGGQALRGLEGGGGYAPAHYLKQYHPKYATADELAQKAKAEGFNNWVNLFKFKNDWALNPDLPVVTPWKTVSPINKPTWTLERNPYSYWVDTAGNQLPYIDKIVMTLGENLEIINLRAIAGEYDEQERHMDLGKLPVFIENQAKFNYTVHLDPGDYGADAGFHINLAYDKDPEVAKWLTNREFRRALSLGVERDQLNETFWLGTGVPGSVIPAKENKYNPGEEKYRTLWHTYDPKKANDMLDSIGLDKKDGEGFRLRTDGTGRLRIEVQTYGGQFLQFTQIVEMVRQQWKKIGIDVVVKEVERSLGINRIAANEHQIFVWTNDDSVPELLYSGKVIPTRADGWAFHGKPYADWFQSNGQQGRKPEGKLLEALEKFRAASAAKTEAERITLCKDIWAIAVDEVFTIGTVAISPASQGVRIANNKLGNIPGRIVNNVAQRHPGLSLPATYFFKG